MGPDRGSDGGVKAGDIVKPVVSASLRVCHPRLMLGTIFALTAFWCSFAVWLHQTAMDEQAATHRLLRHQLRAQAAAAAGQQGVGAHGAATAGGGGNGTSAFSTTQVVGARRDSFSAFLDDYRYERGGEWWKRNGSKDYAADWKYTDDFFHMPPRPPSPPRPPPPPPESGAKGIRIENVTFDFLLCERTNFCLLSQCSEGRASAAYTLTHLAVESPLTVL